MKQTKQVPIGILLFFISLLCSCEKEGIEMPIEPLPASTKAASGPDDKIYFIKDVMNNLDHEVPFMGKLINQYGAPLYSYALSMGTDQDDRSYLVPLFKYENGNIINAVWFFDFSGDTLRYKVITRDNQIIKYYQQTFVFDELSFNMFGEQSDAGMIFVEPAQTYGWETEYYDCHFGIIEWNDVEVSRELYCKERTVWRETVSVPDKNPNVGDGEIIIPGGGGPGGSDGNGNVNDGRITESNLKTKRAELESDLKVLGYSLDGIEIEKSTSCIATARIITRDGKKVIQVSPRFFTKEYRDQKSIILHELIHAKNDLTFSLKEVPLAKPIILQIPMVSLDYIVNDFKRSGGSDFDFAMLVETEVTIARDPNYHQNEINAYSEEIRLNGNVSVDYGDERTYMLWRHQELYRIAKEYYK